MDERDLEPEQALARHVVDELRARDSSSSSVARRSSVASATWCMPGPRRARKRPTGVSSPGRRDELDAAVADQHRCSLDALLAKRLAMLEPCVEELLVRRDRLVEIGHGDAEMVDPAHAGDATRAGSVAHGQSAHGADGLGRVRLRHDVGEQRLELGAIERLLLEQRGRHAIERGAVLCASRRFASSYA